MKALLALILILCAGCFGQPIPKAAFVPPCDSEAPRHYEVETSHYDMAPTANLMVERGWSNVQTHDPGFMLMKTVSGDCIKEADR